MSTTLADLKAMIEDYETTKLRLNQMEHFCRACIAVVTRHCEINNVECLAVPKDERFREIYLAADDGKISMAYGYADLIPQPKVVINLDPEVARVPAGVNYQHEAGVLIDLVKRSGQSLQTICDVADEAGQSQVYTVMFRPVIEQLLKGAASAVVKLGITGSPP